MMCEVDNTEKTCCLINCWLSTEFVQLCSTLVHLSRNGAEVAMFAPDINQKHVINHINGEHMESERFMICICFVIFSFCFCFLR